MIEAGGGRRRSSEDPSVHYYVPGVPLPKPDLIRAIRRAACAASPPSSPRWPAARRIPAARPGWPRCSRRSGAAEYEDERDARFINDRVHANIQKDRTFSVVPRIYGGVTSAAELRRIADVADKYQVPMVKITGGQRIDLLGIRKEKLPEVWRTSACRPGTPTRRRSAPARPASAPSSAATVSATAPRSASPIERRFQGIESPHKMKLATAGCPRNCSEATTKDIGAVAIEGGRWEIYVGGAAGSRVRKGDLLVHRGHARRGAAVHGPLHAVLPRERASTWSAPTTSSSGSASRRSGALLVDDEEGIAARSTSACRRRSTPTSIRGWRRTRPFIRRSSGTRFAERPPAPSPSPDHAGAGGRL